MEFPNLPIAEQIQRIKDVASFDSLKREAFRYQRTHLPIYDAFLASIGSTNNDFPFLPIEAFKHHPLNCKESTEVVFKSSGTTGMLRSEHHVHSTALYDELSRAHFEHHFGALRNATLLALLPSYQAAGDSSLVHMVHQFMQQASSESRFVPTPAEAAELLSSIKNPANLVLIGVSFALLDLCELVGRSEVRMNILETGGMKGRRKEITRKELHQTIAAAFPNASIYSEYGMCELLSQAYATEGEVFELPAWAKVCATEVGDPLRVLPNGRRGLLAFTDLANVHSCSFIQTRDIGVVLDERHFTVEGRLDHSDVRGCNLLFS